MTNQQIVHQLLNSSKSAQDFQDKLKDAIDNLKQDILPQSHVDDNLRMKAKFEEYENFFNKTYETISKIEGDNPFTVNSSECVFRKPLLHDRDYFCNRAHEIEKIIAKDNKDKESLKYFESTYGWTENILERLSFLDPSLDFSEMKWVGFKVFKGAFLGNISIHMGK